MSYDNSEIKIFSSIIGDFSILENMLVKPVVYLDISESEIENIKKLYPAGKIESRKGNYLDAFYELEKLNNKSVELGELNGKTL